MRALYRLRQFWGVLFASPAQSDLELARRILSEKQMELFSRMRTGEQAHSLEVFKKICNLGSQETATADLPPDAFRQLLVAALLHDVGKSRFPLYAWERGLVVIARALWSEKARAWGQGRPPGGWRRPFIIAEQHPEWGAELAAGAGASPLAVNLIRRHQNPLPSSPVSLEDRLLQILQSVDSDS